jgi:2-polyprenyl-6-methoxyphenol hydroxylase-like FAD-dependent oxidoreductase
MLSAVLIAALSLGLVSPFQAHETRHSLDQASTATEQSLRSPAGNPEVRTQEGLTAVLVNIYERYQSARNVLDPARLEMAATQIYGRSIAAELRRVVESEKARFSVARDTALKRAQVRLNGKQIVVSGLSSSGAASAMLALNAGYSVPGFEHRNDFSRNIQWTARQSIIDSLALLDSDMAERFTQQVAGRVPHETDLVNGKVAKIVPVAPPHRGEPMAIPDTPGEMLDKDAVMTLQTKGVEGFMMSELQRRPNVTIHRGQTMTLHHAGSSIAVDGVGVPELVVVAEGSNSKTRQSFGVEFAHTSPTRWQIAGQLRVELGGNLAFNEQHVTYPDGRKDVLWTSGISTAGSGASWSVTDVPETVNLEPQGLTPGTEEYKAAKQELVNSIYFKALAQVLQRSEAEVRSMVVEGPIGKGAPTPFQLQQNISRTAVYADNVVAIGDTVGNAHWNVGGGVHIAIVSHLRRLANLLFDLEIGRNRKVALAEYDRKVRADSLEWGRRGVTDFYPGVDPEFVRARFDEAVRSWEKDQDKSRSPLERMHTSIMRAARAGVSGAGEPGGPGRGSVAGANRCIDLFL